MFMCIQVCLYSQQKSLVEAATAPSDLSASAGSVAAELGDSVSLDGRRVEGSGGKP